MDPRHVEDRTRRREEGRVRPASSWSRFGNRTLLPESWGSEDEDIESVSSQGRPVEIQVSDVSSPGADAALLQRVLPYRACSSIPKGAHELVGRPVKPRDNSHSYALAFAPHLPRMPSYSYRRITSWSRRPRRRFRHTGFFDADVSRMESRKTEVRKNLPTDDL